MSGKILGAYKAALPVSLPIIGSFLAVGMSYGLFVNANGLPGWYAPMMAIAIFGGSMEFVAVTLLMGTFAPLETIVLALMIQSRHIFYGISMLRRYNTRGWRKFYLIYSLCDESFSINREVDAPDGIDRVWFMVAVSSLNQASWIIGAFLGGMIGQIVPFDISGLGFTMTALFVVILVDHMLKEKKPYTMIIGFVSSLICLAIFGPGSFLVPTLAVMLLLLMLFHRPIWEVYRK